VDAGLYRKASLGDRVWLDRDKDGIQDANEQGVSNVSVTLLDSTSGATIGTTTTNSVGNYSFTNLDPGSYTLVFDKTLTVSGGVAMRKYVWGPQNAGSNDSIDSDVQIDPANKDKAFTTDPILLDSGENI